MAGVRGMRRRCIWTADKEALFVLRWNNGVLYKAISNELGIGHASLKRMRDRLGLRPRKFAANDMTRKKHQISFYVDANMLDQIQRQAYRRNACIPGYVRTLIGRDLGLL